MCSIGCLGVVEVDVSDTTTKNVVFYPKFNSRLNNAVVKCLLKKCKNIIDTT